MIVLNLLNQLFGRRDSLSRSDIDAYQKDTSQRQRIEENAAADAFDNNALEGWSESGLETDAMKQLDQRIAKKYGSPQGSIFLKLALATFIIGSGLLLYFSYQPTPSTSTENDSTLVVLNQDTERTEIDLSPEIEALVEISEDAQVRPQELIAKNIAQNVDEPTTHNDVTNTSDDVAQKLPDLPIIKEDTKPEIAPALIYSKAKEIYLKDLKLIDYREYRDGEVTTERLRYSGTPANQSTWEQPNDEELVWEKVNIPYIEYIDKTMELIAQNKYKKALSRLELILENYSDDINANFYSGLSYFNLGKYDLAIERFEKSYTIQFGNFYEEARWFKSLALEKAKKSSEARKLWKEIKAENGFYAKEAEMKLKK